MAQKFVMRELYNERLSFSISVWEICFAVFFSPIEKPIQSFQ